MKPLSKLEHSYAKSTEFNSDDFAFIAQLAKRQFGLCLSDNKMPLVKSRISKRMRELGITEFQDYRSYLENRGNRAEETNLLSVLTTNVTSFFRENHHFDHLVEAAKNALKKTKTPTQSVRIWSAACSTGQEIYSAGMCVADACSEADFKRFEFYATDIDPQVIRAAKRGLFSVSEIDSIPRGLARKYTEKVSDSEFRIRSDLVSKINFSEFNLVKQVPNHAPYDFIFCRNAAIYFDQHTQAKLWKTLSGSLRESGVLYIGHSERVHGEANESLSSCGITTFVRR